MLDTLARSMPGLIRLELTAVNGSTLFSDTVRPSFRLWQPSAPSDPSCPLAQSVLWPLLLQLPALRHLTLTGPLSQDPSASLFACSAQCSSIFLSRRPRYRAAVKTLGGYRAVNLLISELHLARLRPVASCLAIGTRVEWTMIDDSSRSGLRGVYKPDGALGVPSFEGMVDSAVDEGGVHSQVLVMTLSKPWMTLSSDDAKAGRCFSCDKRNDAAGAWDPLHCITSSFSSDELKAACRVVRARMKEEEMAASA